VEISCFLVQEGPAKNKSKEKRISILFSKVVFSFIKKEFGVNLFYLMFKNNKKYTPIKICGLFFANSTMNE